MSVVPFLALDEWTVHQQYGRDSSSSFHSCVASRARSTEVGRADGPAGGGAAAAAAAADAVVAGSAAVWWAWARGDVSEGAVAVRSRAC